MSSETEAQGLPHRFAEVATTMGLVNEAQIEEALKRKRSLRFGGVRSRLGEILVAMNVLSTEQVKQVLAEQRKRRTAAAQKALPMEYFGDYKLIEKLGEGGMGAVFKARETLADRVIALKVLRKNYASNANFVERFNREARLAGALSHPNIVTCHNAGTCRGVQFLAMEFVNGETLAARLKREGGKMPEAEALRVAREVALGLAHAHGKGVLHRDIKPDNILLGLDGSIKISDFGTAKSFLDEESLTQTGVIIGTPYFISPEQVKGDKSVDHRADLYSLGAMLYLALTGQVPFEAANPLQIMRAHLSDEPRNPRDLNPQLSAGAVLVVSKLMAKAPDARYQSGIELAEDIDRVLAGQPPLHAAPSQPKPAVRPKRTLLPRTAKTPKAASTPRKWSFAGCLSMIALAGCTALALSALLSTFL